MTRHRRLPLLCGTMLVALLNACGPITFTVGTSPTDRKITWTTIEDAGGFIRDRVAIIDITGMIHNSHRRGLLSEYENPVGLLHEKLEAARRDTRVRAVILRLNTPGGTVTASDAMYREIRRFRAQAGKPVVALMMDVAASGGYYVALGADRIIAYPTSVTGSIGVIIQTVSFKPAMDRFGIHAEAFTSGPNKAVASPLGDMTDEHRAVLRALVDDFYDRFVALVRDRRPNIPDDTFATVIDGRVVTGQAARELDLIDRTGDLYDAFDVAKEMAGLRRADLILYHREGQFAGNAYAVGPKAPPQAVQFNLAQINIDATLADTPVAFLYLWRASHR